MLYYLQLRERLNKEELTMAINFNSLPTQKPAQSTVLAKGRYHAVIKDAKMKQPNDPSKPEYLTMMMQISDPASKSNMGNVFINLFESQAALPLYQISRFIQALKLPITGDFELKDLTKMVIGKELEIDLCPEEKKDGSAPMRTVLDISAECFYPLGGEQAPWEFPEPMTDAPAITSQY